MSSATNFCDLTCPFSIRDFLDAQRLQGQSWVPRRPPSRAPSKLRSKWQKYLSPKRHRRLPVDPCRPHGLWQSQHRQHLHAVSAQVSSPKFTMCSMRPARLRTMPLAIRATANPCITRNLLALVITIRPIERAKKCTMVFITITDLGASVSNRTQNLQPRLTG